MMCSNQSEEKEVPDPPDGYSSNTILKIAYFLGFLDLVDTEPEVPLNINEFRDIVYKRIQLYIFLFQLFLCFHALGDVSSN